MTAKEQYLKAYDEIATLTGTIMREFHDGCPQSLDSVNYADAGSAQKIVSDLRAILDTMNNRG